MDFMREINLAYGQRGAFVSDYRLSKQTEILMKLYGTSYHILELAKSALGEPMENPKRAKLERIVAKMNKEIKRIEDEIAERIG